jgi:hemoglobin-like flavoprotein
MLFDKEILSTFDESLKRSQADSRFLNLFYQNFVFSNPAVREKFANTDMQNQKMMLHASLHMIMLATQNNKAATAYLDQVALQHSKSVLDIGADLYNDWLEALITTVNVIDPEYTKEIETAWRIVMNYGIEYMKSKYDTELS